MSQNYSAKQTGSGGMSFATQTPANSNVGHHDKPKVFDAEGSIGKQFTEGGALGGAAQKIGGPLDKDGAIGKQFTAGGGIGGAVQDALGGNKGSSN
ncbi:hypothetical protein VPNG_03460 [Cytospora leucostoma]|uniref:Uncharacterized protein n=1 Tax=Cytospora leucostoma TaxID=1230097 RepID=A0A423XFZ2_9PEZI|nr:hypothetical protein VPNG_03460 [Cytospora leucostoma]